MLRSIFLFMIYLGCLISARLESRSGDDAPVVLRDVANGRLDVFQVQAPLRKSYEGASCERTIVEHVFASYGDAFVGNEARSILRRSPRH